MILCNSERAFLWKESLDNGDNKQIIAPEFIDN